MATREVTDQTFDQEVLKSDRPVLVDLWAEWCAPCKMLAPIVEQLSVELADRLEVVKLDVDANPATAMRYGVQSIPTLLLFKDGQEVERLVGYMPKDRLLSRLQRHL